VPDVARSPRIELPLDESRHPTRLIIYVLKNTTAKSLDKSFSVEKRNISPLFGPFVVNCASFCPCRVLNYAPGRAIGPRDLTYPHPW
jgi:hypothetical protein